MDDQQYRLYQAALECLEELVTIDEKARKQKGAQALDAIFDSPPGTGDNARVERLLSRSRYVLRQAKLN